MRRVEPGYLYFNKPRLSEHFSFLELSSMQVPYASMWKHICFTWMSSESRFPWEQIQQTTRSPRSCKSGVQRNLRGLDTQHTDRQKSLALEAIPASSSPSELRWEWGLPGIPCVPVQFGASVSDVALFNGSDSLDKLPSGLFWKNVL